MSSDSEEETEPSIRVYGSKDGSHLGVEITKVEHVLIDNVPLFLEKNKKFDRVMIKYDHVTDYSRIRDFVGEWSGLETRELKIVGLEPQDSFFESLEGFLRRNEVGFLNLNYKDDVKDLLFPRLKEVISRGKLIHELDLQYTERLFLDKKQSAELVDCISQLSDVGLRSVTVHFWTGPDSGICGLNSAWTKSEEGVEALEKLWRKFVVHGWKRCSFFPRSYLEQVGRFEYLKSISSFVEEHYCDSLRRRELGDITSLVLLIREDVIPLDISRSLKIFLY